MAGKISQLYVEQASGKGISPELLLVKVTKLARLSVNYEDEILSAS